MHFMDKIVSEKHLLNHSFYQRWVSGDLKLEELKNYAIQYYPHVAAFPTYVSAVHSRCEDAGLRQELLQNLREEEEGDENHPELWLRFGEAVGNRREEMIASKKIPESLEVVQKFRELTQKSFAAGLGALYAYESQIPAIATKKIEGLKQFYGISSKAGTQFFSVHQKADEFHSQTARNAIDRLSVEEKEEAKESAREACSVLWNFLSALDREAGSSCATTEQPMN